MGADRQPGQPRHEHGDQPRRPHDHQHGVGLARAGERHRGRLAVAFAITLGFFFVQATAGILANSLALLSDAAHMLTDVIGLGMALAAIQLATRFAERNDESGRRSPHTFGLYRLEILAAFVNSLLLVGVAIWVLVEAGRRIFDEPEVLGLPMLIVAAIGLIVNVIAFVLLREGSKESINLEGAYLEVVADGIGSVGVIFAAVLLQVFGWAWVDPVAGAAIGLWILPRTFRLGRRAVRILLQAAPEHVDLDALCADLEAIEGVVDVHDLHVWTLTSEMDAASAHLMTSGDADAHVVLDRARAVLAGTHHIEHATFQVEPDTHEGCRSVTW